MWCAALVLLDVVVAVVGRCVVGCEHHIQQNQRSTPHAVTHVMVS